MLLAGKLLAGNFGSETLLLASNLGYPHLTRLSTGLSTTVDKVVDNSVTILLPFLYLVWLVLAPASRTVLCMETTRSAAAAVAHARTLAGADYRWNHTDAPSSKNALHIRGLSSLLAVAQNGLCVACGDTLAGEATNLCHVVASRRTGYGIMPGNVYVGHVGCNDDDSKVYGDIVPLRSLVRADLLPLVHPSRAECIREAARLDAKRAERRARRSA